MKKIVSILMALVICMNGVSVKAYSDTDEVLLSSLTEADLEACITVTALDWADMMQPGMEFTVEDITYIVSQSLAPEYAVSFFYHSIPYGYAVVTFQNGDACVKEGQLVEGKEGLRTEIVNEIEGGNARSVSDTEVSDALVEIAPLQYGAVTKDEDGQLETVHDNYGNEYDLEDVNAVSEDAEELLYDSTKYDNTRSIYIEKVNWIPSKYQVKSELTLQKYKENSRMFSEKTIENWVGKYACAVQALTQIACMEKMCDRLEKEDTINTYNKLWKYTKTQETADSKKDTTNNIIYGETSLENAAEGFVKFAQEKGYKNTEVKGIETDPSVSWLKNKLEFNRPILMSYGINVDNKRAGHEISILGYRRATKVSSGNTYDYLMVYNSWDVNPVYLNYSTVDMMDCRATYFWVK